MPKSPTLISSLAATQWSKILLWTLVTTLNVPKTEKLIKAELGESGMLYVDVHTTFAWYRFSTIQLFRREPVTKH